MARATYWNSTKFADQLRKLSGMPQKLKSGTIDEWREWNEDCYKANPAMYWVIETGFNKVQNFFCWPKDKLGNIRVYLRNRFVTKTHLIQNGLEKGKWHETDTQMLHGMFQLLVDFVEVQCAWMETWSDSAARPVWWKRIAKGEFGQWRSAELGVRHLEWERSLSASEHGGQGPTHQAVSAEEILHLYTWWTITRPNRRDPYGDFDDEAFLASIGSGMKCGSKRTPEQKANRKDWMQEVTRLEEAYEKEDEEKMLRLVKIRQSLWT